jgi:hypothetical protein
MTTLIPVIKKCNRLKTGIKCWGGLLNIKKHYYVEKFKDKELSHLEGVLKERCKHL